MHLFVPHDSSARTGRRVLLRGTRWLLQASRTELLAELKRLQAVQLGPYWRLIDTAYLGAVLEMLLVR
jgi:hypothetical protein